MDIYGLSVRDLLTPKHAFTGSFGFLGTDLTGKAECVKFTFSSELIENVFATLALPLLNSGK